MPSDENGNNFFRQAPVQNEPTPDYRFKARAILPIPLAILAVGIDE